MIDFLLMLAALFAFILFGMLAPSAVRERYGEHWSMLLIIVWAFGGVWVLANGS